MLDAYAVAWASLAVSSLVSALWPVRRKRSRLSHIALAIGAIALVLLAFGGHHPMPRDIAASCLIASAACMIGAAVFKLISRRWTGRPVLRRRRSRISTSHVQIWVDAIGAGLALAAFAHANGASMAACTGAAVASSATGVVQSIKLEHRKARGIVF